MFFSREHAFSDTVVELVEFEFMERGPPVLCINFIESSEAWHDVMVVEMAMKHFPILSYLFG